MEVPARRRFTRPAIFRLRLSAGLFCVVFAAGCRGGQADGPGDDRIPVAATIGMIADIVAAVGGERVQVTALMGPGVDPHLYKASAGDVRTLSGSDIIFYNGLHLEAAMAEVLEQMDRTSTTVAVTDGIDRERLLTPPEFDGLYDPHVWFDVTLWSEAVTEVARSLSEYDPDHAAEYETRASQKRAELKELDAWVRDQVQTLPESRRVLVTAHDAFNYFGLAYGVDVRGLIGINTATEAGTADVQDLASYIVERGIPAIFVETSIPRRTVEAVQAAVEARGFSVEIGGALFSDAMGSPGTPEGTYVGMVRHNVSTVVGALSKGAH